MRKPMFAAVAIAAAATLALAGCGGASPDPAASQEFAVAGNFPIVALDPYGQYSADAGLNFVGQQIYDTLISPDGEGGYVAALATEWEPTDDGQVWTFTLRDAEFSDGTPFTSADVASSVSLMVAGGGPFAGSWESIAVSTPDDRTVVFETENTGSAILSLISQLFITPVAAADASFFAEPVGIGPFTVESFTSEQEVVLTKNPTYWGEPALADRVTLKTITDISARVTALLNDEVQAVWGIPDDQFAPLESNGSLETAVKASYSQFTMWMNSQQSVLSDVTVREAIWRAIDFEEIQKALYPYSATMSAAPVSQAVVGAGSFEPYAYDPELAQQLLAEAGYPDGLTVRIQYSSARDFEQLAAAMKSYLAAVGVDLQVEPKEHAVWLEDLLALNFDMNIQTTGPANGDPTSDLSRLYKCSANRTGFCDAELDELIALGDSQLDPAERSAIFVDVQRVIWDNIVGMFPMDVATTYAWSTSLDGFVPSPNFAPDLSTVKVNAE